jgi:hypothetical protein
MDLLIGLIVLLAILWFLGVIFFPFGGLIHILLVIAIIVIVYRLVTGKKL